MLTPEARAAHFEALDRTRLYAVPRDNFAQRDEAVRVAYGAGVAVAEVAAAVHLPPWRIRKLILEHKGQPRAAVARLLGRRG
jgi:hypothetical protein